MQRSTTAIIFVGVSPDTGRPMYTTPKDAPLSCTFEEAAKYATILDAHGYKDWRVPTKGELDVLFHNRAAIGNFNSSGSYPACWYWSSSQNNGYHAWSQRFSDGDQHYGGKGSASSLRCVRG